MLSVAEWPVDVFSLLSMATVVVGAKLLLAANMNP
jgi:hypothetical protein